MTTDTIPRARARASRHPDGVWDLVVDECPFCHAKHSHGGGAGEKPEYGHRVAHCAKKSKLENTARGYILEPVG